MKSLIYFILLILSVYVFFKILSIFTPDNISIKNSFKINNNQKELINEVLINNNNIKKLWTNKLSLPNEIKICNNFTDIKNTNFKYYKNYYFIIIDSLENEIYIYFEKKINQNNLISFFTKLFSWIKDYKNESLILENLKINLLKQINNFNIDIPNKIDVYNKIKIDTLLTTIYKKYYYENFNIDLINNEIHYFTNKLNSILSSNNNYDSIKTNDIYFNYNILNNQEFYIELISKLNNNQYKFIKNFYPVNINYKPLLFYGELKSKEIKIEKIKDSLLNTLKSNYNLQTIKLYYKQPYSLIQKRIKQDFIGIGQEYFKN